MSALFRIMALWRGRAPWLALGVAMSLAALCAGVLMMVLAGAVAGALLMPAAAAGAPLALRLTGPSRVLLRYLERLATHDATFRALADLRVWFFRGLAARSAGGLGFRRSGDMLSRLVSDVEALDALYLRILVPLAGAVLVLPALAILLGRVDAVAAAIVCGLFGISAFLLPTYAARAAATLGDRLAAAGSALRVASSTRCTGCARCARFPPRAACWPPCRRAKARCWARSTTLRGAACCSARSRS